MSTNYLISSFPFSDHFLSSLVWVLFLTDDLIPALLDSETVLESQASLSQGLWLGFTGLSHFGLSEVEYLSWLVQSMYQGPSKAHRTRLAKG